MWLISLDPGKRSGVALFERTDDGVFLEESHELDPFDTWRWLDDQMIFHFRDGVEVVAEAFIITKYTAEKSQSPWSLEILGMARGLAWQHLGKNYEITLQRPSDAKSLFPNERLRAVGFWHKGGEGHALDAIRHGALYFVRNGWRDSRLVLPSET